MGGETLVLVHRIPVQVGDQSKVVLLPAPVAQASTVAIETRMWSARALVGYQCIGIPGPERYRLAQIEFLEQTPGNLAGCLIFCLDPETGAEDLESVVVGPDQAVEVISYLRRRWPSARLRRIRCVARQEGSDPVDH